MPCRNAWAEPAYKVMAWQAFLSLNLLDGSCQKGVIAATQLHAPAVQGYSSGEPSKRVNPLHMAGMFAMLGLVGTTIKVAVDLISKQ